MRQHAWSRRSTPVVRDRFVKRVTDEEAGKLLLNYWNAGKQHWLQCLRDSKRVHAPAAAGRGRAAPDLPGRARASAGPLTTTRWRRCSTCCRTSDAALVSGTRFAVTTWCARAAPLQSRRWRSTCVSACRVRCSGDCDARARAHSRKASGPRGFVPCPWFVVLCLR